MTIQRPRPPQLAPPVAPDVDGYVPQGPPNPSGWAPPRSPSSPVNVSPTMRADNPFAAWGTAKLLAFIDGRAQQARAAAVSGVGWDGYGPPNPATWGEQDKGWITLDDTARDFAAALWAGARAPVDTAVAELDRRRLEALDAMARLPEQFEAAVQLNAKLLDDAIAAFWARCAATVTLMAKSFGEAFRAFFGAPPTFFYLVGITVLLVPIVGGYALAWSPTAAAIGKGAGGALVGVGRGAGTAIASSGKLAGLVGA